jgi:broad specificity phosphatase PhoE
LTNPLERVADAPLTPLGHDQAARLAEHLARDVIPDRSSAAAQADLSQAPLHGYGITRLYCSPMWRSLQTAEPLGRALGLAPEVWLDLHEQGGIYLDEEGGPVGYPGQTPVEIQRDFPGYRLPAALDERGWWQGGYEDMPACCTRAARVAEALRARAADGDLLALITHGTFLDVLIRQLLGQPLEPAPAPYYLHYNTGISRLDFLADGRLIVRYLNRIGHLPAHWVT